MIQVDDRHRINPRSLVPGGTKVRIKLKNKTMCQYDKIKGPQSYVNQVLRNHGNDVQEIQVLQDNKWLLVYQDT